MGSSSLRGCPFIVVFLFNIMVPIAAAQALGVEPVQILDVQFRGDFISVFTNAGSFLVTKQEVDQILVWMLEE